MSPVVFLSLVAANFSDVEASPVQSIVRIEALLKDEDPSVDGIKTLAVERPSTFAHTLAPDIWRHGGGGAFCSIGNDRQLTNCRFHGLTPSSDGMIRLYRDALSRVRITPAAYAQVRGRLISVSVTFETIVEHAPESREAVCIPPFCTSEGGVPAPPPPPSSKSGKH